MLSPLARWLRPSVVLAVALSLASAPSDLCAQTWRVAASVGRTGGTPGADGPAGAAVFTRALQDDDGPLRFDVSTYAGSAGGEFLSATAGLELRAWLRGGWPAWFPRPFIGAGLGALLGEGPSGLFLRWNAGLVFAGSSRWGIRIEGVDGRTGDSHGPDLVLVGVELRLAGR